MHFLMLTRLVTTKQFKTLYHLMQSYTVTLVSKQTSTGGPLLSVDLTVIQKT
jgi:hypothetical protein